MDTNQAIPSIVNGKVYCAGKIGGLGLHPLLLSHRQDLGIGQDTRRLLGREERQRLVGVIENQILEVLVVAHAHGFYSSSAMANYPF